jgi:ParB-like chromosome segregation protein Spo0J
METLDEIVEIGAAEIGQGLGDLRTIPKKTVSTMAWSLKRHGQLTPVVLARLEQGSLEMVDGFKRLRAALATAEAKPLRCRIVTMDARRAKIAMYCLNRSSQGLNDVEEALLVRSLYRVERMSQLQIARDLGRHKTWVCRRLQLVECLTERTQEAMRVGLLRPTAARSLVKLPRGNQLQLVEAVARQDLSTRQLERVVALYLSARSPAEQAAILQNPEGALTAKARLDERLSPHGRQAAQRIVQVEQIGSAMVDYLETVYPTATCDHALLAPWLQRLRQAMARLNSALTNFSRSY